MAILKKCWFRSQGNHYLGTLLHENGDAVLLIAGDFQGGTISPPLRIKLDKSLLEELSSAGPVHYRYLGNVEIPQQVYQAQS